jgi:peptidoglycan lytic transglycosylase G
MSELGLSFDETEGPAPGRHRHRRGSSKKPPVPQQRKRGRGKSLLAFTLVVVLLGGLGYAGWWGYNWVRDALTTPDYEGAGTGSTTVEIPAGATAADIANLLYEADVVASPQAFVDAANANPLSVNIQPGSYQIPQQMSADNAVTWLLDLEHRIVELVTIPEGLSIFRTFALLSEELGIPVEDFEAAAEDPEALGVPEFWYNRDDDREASGTVEGFLFPASYEFSPEPTAVEVLEKMVGQFLTEVEQLGFVNTVEDDRGITPYEALIAASLAQAEAGTADDLGRVARVAYNRVYQANIPLQFDVTAQYWLEVQGEEPRETGELTNDELDDPDNPFNTVSQTGWPRGPINNPGRAALEAAMEPAEGGWLYFVLVDPDTGESAFAETLAEHDANIQRACDNGVSLSQC